MWAAARTVSERLSMTAAQDVRVTRRPTAWAADALRVRSWVGRPRPGALERTGTTDPSSRRVARARPRFVREVSSASQSCERVAGERERWATIRSSRVGKGGVWGSACPSFPGVCRERCPATASLFL